MKCNGSQIHFPQGYTQCIQYINITTYKMSTARFLTGNMDSFDWEVSGIETNTLYELKMMMNCPGPTLLIL